MELTEETDVRLTTTRRFQHVGICIFGIFHPYAEKSPISVRFGLVADTIGYLSQTPIYSLNMVTSLHRCAPVILVGSYFQGPNKGCGQFFLYKSM